jgi:hypothetical protein
MLRNTAISPYPQSPFPQPQFRQNPPPLSPRSSAPGTRGPQAPGTQAPPVFRSNELRAADARANALPHHPSTPAGRGLYTEQVAAWNKAFPGCLKANKFCPYPLTPGTAALGSNECFGCGHVGHRAPDCPNPGSLPQHERGWRVVAAIIFGVIRGREPASVRYVDYAPHPQYPPREQWYPQNNSYNRGTSQQPYYEYQDQGNGEGPSTQ